MGNPRLDSRDNVSNGEISPRVPLYSFMREAGWKTDGSERARFQACPYRVGVLCGEKGYTS